MDTAAQPASPGPEDLAYQDFILQGVSRTFALTIPQLPPGLQRAVGNAYLLCRIADTVEDEATLDYAQKRDLAARFVAVVEGSLAAERFAEECTALLSEQTLPAERDLVAHTPRVIRVTHSFNPAQRQALARCVRIMASGMADYQSRESLDGLEDLADMSNYCYYVAGVVGEMLTELFCDYSPELARHRERLLRLSVSFGQGLQMTNILKDIWEDRRRGACWLPRELFRRHGVVLRDIVPGSPDPGFGEALAELIGVARGHLRNALTYTLYLPRREKGMRRFCLWALGMAVLTLRKINRNRNFSSGAQVKISRRSVKATIALSNLAVSSDTLLELLFDLGTRGLPPIPDHEKITKLGIGAESRT